MNEGYLNQAIAQQKQSEWILSNRQNSAAMGIVGANLSNCAPSLKPPSARDYLMEQVETLKLEVTKRESMIAKLDKAGLLDMPMHELRQLVNF